MPDLLVAAAQPNPPGKDSSRRGLTTNTKLNEEWLEFEVRTIVISQAMNSTMPHSTQTAA